MYRHRVIALYSLLLVSCLVAPASAQKEVHVGTLGTTIVTPLTPGGFATQTSTCKVGNTNAPVLPLEDFILPPDKYAVVFDPAAGCSACNVGIKISAIHVLLQSAAACSLVMDVGVQDLAKPGEPGYDPSCPSPGFQICASGQSLVILPGTGTYDVSLPADCGCFGVDRQYLLSMEIVSSTCTPGPDLLLDFLPSDCTNWNYFAGSWLDLSTDFHVPGDLLFSADTECCAPTVGIEEKDWGTIKRLYLD